MDPVIKYSIKSSRGNDVVLPSLFPGNTRATSRRSQTQKGRPYTKPETPLMERQSMSAALPSNSTETELTQTPVEIIAILSQPLGLSPPSTSPRLFAVWRIYGNFKRLRAVPYFRDGVLGALNSFDNFVPHRIDVSITSTSLPLRFVS